MWIFKIVHDARTPPAMISEENERVPREPSRLHTAQHHIVILRWAFIARRRNLWARPQHEWHQEFIGPSARRKHGPQDDRVMRRPGTTIPISVSPPAAGFSCRRPCRGSRATAPGRNTTIRPNRDLCM